MSCYPEKRNGRLTGTWIAEATLTGVGRVRKRCTTQKEGERWANIVTLTGKVPEEAQPVKPTGPTFGEVAAACKDAGGPDGSWHRERDPSVLQRLDYVIAFIGRDTQLASIGTMKLDELVADLRKRPGKKKGAKMSPRTINRYLTAASCIFTFAETRARDFKVPDYRGPHVPWQEGGEDRIWWITVNIEEEVCAHMAGEGRHASVLVTGALTATGMRWGELESMERDQVDMSSEQAWVRLWKTKTDAPRSIPISQQLAKGLKALVAAKGVPVYHTYRKHLKAALKSAGQSPEVSIHSLRHSTATRLVLAGVQLPIVQKFMGHSNIQTTMKYVHMADEHLVEASKKLSPRAGQINPEDANTNVFSFVKKIENVELLEATPGIEPGYTVLQTVA